MRFEHCCVVSNDFFPLLEVLGFNVLCKGWLSHSFKVNWLGSLHALEASITVLAVGLWVRSSAPIQKNVPFLIFVFKFMSGVWGWHLAGIGDSLLAGAVVYSSVFWSISVLLNHFQCIFLEGIISPHRILYSITNKSLGHSGSDSTKTN